MESITINNAQVENWINLLKQSEVPDENESATHSFVEEIAPSLLANSYFAIVAICHQTSPLGERKLEGNINGVRKVGWDYLKERYLTKVHDEPKWASPDYWKTISPLQLSKLYDDSAAGNTLNRINERTYLLNDLGNKLKNFGHSEIQDAFNAYNGIIGGESGFLSFLNRFEAYKDPVMKKSHFFLSIVTSELSWQIQDKDELLSPVDYHELRGHLRIGTLNILDQHFANKVEQGIPLSEAEDTEIRRKVQEINNIIGKETGLGSSKIHYLFWNVFRNCCPRESYRTHCRTCGTSCSLDKVYKSMSIYNNRCLFSPFCHSSNKENKVVDPPYIGHYY